MSTLYPGAIDNGTTLPNPSASQDTNSPSLSSGQGNQNDALIALENKLGTGSSTPSGTYALVSTGTGSSAWSLPTPVGTILGTSDTQIITNKTINASNNTITNLSGSNIANLSITATQIANATITATQIANATITATQIANATITATQIANGGINYVNLLSTIFSGQVATYTNGATNGSYINLGGIKLCWGYTTVTVAATGTAYSWSFNFPTSFFTTIGAPIVSMLGGNSLSRLGNGTYEAASTSSLNGFVESTGGTYTLTIYVICIGT